MRTSDSGITSIIYFYTRSKIFSTTIHFHMFQLANSEDLDNDIDELLHEFESKFARTILHTVLFY